VDLERTSNAGYSWSFKFASAILMIYGEKRASISSADIWLQANL